MYDTIVFDLGGVLIDWNPRYVFRQLFVTKEAMEYFLHEICTSEWNEMQDAGRSFQEATQLLTDKYPEYTQEILAYYGRWKEMLGGHIDDTVDILSTLKQSGQYKLYALTNWSDESFPVALEMYAFLHWFDGILVSGKEKMKKPDPRIFELLFERYGLDRKKTIFIDDNAHNIHAARVLGMESVHFLSPDQCRRVLNELLRDITLL